jgi:hypothetical protein
MLNSLVAWHLTVVRPLRRFAVCHADCRFSTTCCSTSWDQPSFGIIANSALYGNQHLGGRVWNLQCKSAARPVVSSFPKLQHDPILSSDASEASSTASTSATILSHTFRGVSNTPASDQSATISLAPIDPPTAWKETTKAEFESNRPLSHMAGRRHCARLGREAGCGPRMVASRARLPIYRWQNV